MRSFLTVIIAIAVFPVAWFVHAGGDKDKKQSKTGKKDALLIVATPGGKEMSLADWRFTQGTRHFSLQDGETKPNSKKPAGPEYLEFREEKSTTYKNGIFTLIPVASLKKITYDRDKKTVAVTVMSDGSEEVTLAGVTRFAGSNRLTIEAEVDIGLGLATEKFQGGIEKGIVSATFPAPTPVAKAKGDPAVVVADDKEKSKHTAFDVQPLYQGDGGYRVVPYLMFKKTVKIDMDKIASVRFVAAGKGSSDYEVTLKDGNKHTLTLLTTIEADDKKLSFVGLVGRVPAGYKLFSLDAIFEYRTDDDEKKDEKK